MLRIIFSRRDRLAPETGRLAGVSAKGSGGSAGSYRKAVKPHIKHPKTDTSHSGLETSPGSLAATRRWHFVFVVHIAERLMSWRSMKLTQRHARGSGPQMGRPRASTVNGARRSGRSNNELAREILSIDVAKGDIRGDEPLKARTNWHFPNDRSSLG